MWLLPVLSRISALAMRTFYRFEVRGSAVPRSGPVLLVANHPNSLLDPGGVAVAAKRPVRFLAKAPFFSQRFVGPLMRATGAIPVYRHMDDPAQVGRNEEMFRFVREALRSGSAVGIFPEGKTHNLPALVPLRTGAARMALGTAPLLGGTFPVIPIGLFFERKEMFRSRALAMIGDPVVWEDLSGRAESDAEAVRELTRRIDGALRAVTINLETWEDAAAIEAAASIYSAEFGGKRGPEVHLRRLQNMTTGLRVMRERDPERLAPLLRGVLHFRDILQRLRLKPGDLSITPRIGLAARWLSQRMLFLVLAAPLALLGRAIFFPPYAATRLLSKRMRVGQETESSLKVLGGAGIYLLWIATVAVAAGFLVGGWAALACILALPLLGFLTVQLDERVRRDLEDARRFLVLRRHSLRERLAARRHELAQELEAVRADLGLQRSGTE